MRDEMVEAKSIVIRDKMKSALTKVLLAAKARRAAKIKAEEGFGVLAEIDVIEGLERYLDGRLGDEPLTEETARQKEVDLVVMALQRLSPACTRVAIYGTPLTVTVPDNRTAEIFRAALAKSAEIRASDRLVRVVVAAH